VAITAAMTDNTGLTKFSKTFPERFFDVGMAEEHAVTFSAGPRLRGLTPLTTIYSTFLQRAFDQIIHDVAVQDLKIVLCLDPAGLVGDDGAPQHGVFDVGYLRMIPGTVVMQPMNGRGAPGHAVDRAYWPGKRRSPCATRARRSPRTRCRNASPHPADRRAQQLRAGGDVAIVALGTMVLRASPPPSSSRRRASRPRSSTRASPPRRRWR
jgi:1-deoxy-D-xylulose-5-phosphate synthase